MAYNILIVDDSGAMRSVIKRTVEMSGIEVGQYYQADSGKTALETLEKEWIDLVLTDINMPEMNGIEMIEHMAANGLLSSIPVIVVSTEASKTRIKQLKEKGVKGYVHKPFTPEQISNEITKVIGVCHAGND